MRRTSAPARYARGRVAAPRAHLSPKHARARGQFIVLQLAKVFRENPVHKVVIRGEVNLDAYRLVREQVDLLLNDPDAVGGAAEPVDAAESESDRLEIDLIRRLFRSDIHRVDQLLLRELINTIGDISDNAENVSRRMEIIALKRRV